MITDEEDETKLEYYVQDREEWTEYSYGFDGLDLILSKDGKSTRLKSFSMLYAEKKNEGIYEWGYAENSTAGYDGIVHITMSTEEGYDSSIEWADGKRAENVTAQIEVISLPLPGTVPIAMITILENPRKAKGENSRVFFFSLPGQMEEQMAVCPSVWMANGILMFMIPLLIGMVN